ncbi:MAG: hypothetical protein ABI239_06485 [Aquihabitans sp.]
MAIFGDDLDPRVSVAAPFVALASVSIVAGGFVAAATGPTDFDKGSWLAAYLVLVGGVALVILGVGQAVFARQAPSKPVIATELAIWVLSAGAIIVGTLAEAVVFTIVGGLLLLGVLVLFVAAVRDASGIGGRLIWLYRAMIVILVVSIPIGLVLAWQRRT